jgi:hypothetical protein
MKTLHSAALLLLSLTGVGTTLAGHDPIICNIEVCIPGETCECPTGAKALIGVVPPRPGTWADGGPPPTCLELVCLPPVIGVQPWIYCDFDDSVLVCEAWPQDDETVSQLEYRWSSDGVVITDPAGFTDATSWRFACGRPPGPGTNTGHAIVEIRWKDSGVSAKTAQLIDCGSGRAVR